MECVCSPVIQNTGSVNTGLGLTCRFQGILPWITMDHHGSPWVTMGSCEIWDLRKLLFGVAQAHMKAKDWTWPKRLADSPHPSPYHLPEMSNQPVICRTPTRQLRRWIRPLDWLKQLVICRTFVGRVWLKWRVLWNLSHQKTLGALTGDCQIAAEPDWCVVVSTEEPDVFAVGFAIAIDNHLRTWTSITVLNFNIYTDTYNPSFQCLSFVFRERNPKAALRVAKEARTMAQKNSDKRAEAMRGSSEGIKHLIRHQPINHTWKPSGLGVKWFRSV